MTAVWMLHAHLSFVAVINPTIYHLHLRMSIHAHVTIATIVYIVTHYQLQKALLGSRQNIIVHDRLERFGRKSRTHDSHIPVLNGHLKSGTMCRNSFSSSFILASDGMFPELAVYCTNEDPLTSSHFARKSERSESVAPCCISHCSFPRRLSESCEVSLLNMVSIEETFVWRVRASE